MVQTTVISVVLALWLCSCCTVFGKTFSNSWAVKIRGGRVMLERLARKHGFVNESQVVADYYVFVHKMAPVRSNSPSTHILEKLLAEPEVLWAEQQVLQPCKLHSSITFNDPMWKYQWYMMRDDGPTYNVLDVWKMGYTGKGVVVAVVDTGLDKYHKELKENFDPEASFDFLDGDVDPSSNDDYDSFSHGNSCAGIIAAVPNNYFCGVGIAYSAKIGGIRIIQDDFTDALKAKGLGFRQDYIDIYSNSWGPADNGKDLGEVGVMTKEAIRQGALQGRNGHGSIFVFSAGNGGYVDDGCSFNGFVNSIYTIAITGVNKDGSLPRYGEHCPGILAVTYSKGYKVSDRTKVITATHYGQCTKSFSGSSAAAAMASGLIALALEANKQLTWRDMQHIIIRSSRAGGKIIQATDWITNAANLTASNSAGFGLMDAYKLVYLAKNWTTVPLQLNCTISHRGVYSVIPSDVLTVSTPYLYVCPGNKINFLEHVQVRINLTYTRRGDLEMNLTSPLGTTSRLTRYRRKDNATYLWDWTILTLHHWGENPSGIWKLTLKNSQLKHKNTGVLFDWALILYGTATDPLERNSHILSQYTTRPATSPTRPATPPTTPATSPTEPTKDASGRSDCIQVGSLVWGLWSTRHGADNYYKAFITELSDTHMAFVLKSERHKSRSYIRTDQFLIIDKIPKKHEISINSRVIALYNTEMSAWYRSGHVIEVWDKWGYYEVRVMFDNDEDKWVTLNQLHLVKRPRFCLNDK